MNDMDQSRRDTINERSSAEDTIGPILYFNNYDILKDLARCFTSKDNPAGTNKLNVQFQLDLNAMIQGDNEYYTMRCYILSFQLHIFPNTYHPMHLLLTDSHWIQDNYW